MIELTKRTRQYTETIQVTISKEMKKQLQELCVANNCKMAGLLRHLIKQSLKELSNEH